MEGGKTKNPHYSRGVDKPQLTRIGLPDFSNFHCYCRGSVFRRSGTRPVLRVSSLYCPNVCNVRFTNCLEWMRVTL